MSVAMVRGDLGCNETHVGADVEGNDLGRLFEDGFEAGGWGCAAEPRARRADGGESEGSKSIGPSGL